MITIEDIKCISLAKGRGLIKPSFLSKIRDQINKAFDLDLIKAKYIRREGSKGNYKYIYEEGSGGGKQNKEPKKVFTSKRTGETIKLGRSGKSIERTATNPAQTAKGLDTFLKKEGIKPEYNKSKTTSSQYYKFTKEGNNYDIRIANHSKAGYSPEMEEGGIDITLYSGNTVSVDIDTSFGYTSKDIKNIIGGIESKQKDINSLMVKSPTIKDIYDNRFNLSKLAKEISKHDPYGINSLLVMEKLKDIKNSKNFKNYENGVKEKAKKKAEEFNESKNFNGVGVSFTKNEFGRVGVEISISESNRFTKRDWKEIRSFSGRGNDVYKKLNSGEITKKEAFGVIEDKIKRSLEYKKKMNNSKQS